jgi:hypothetical protein
MFFPFLNFAAILKNHSSVSALCSSIIMQCLLLNRQCPAKMSLLPVLHHTKNRIIGADCYLFISYWCNWQSSTNILERQTLWSFQLFQLPVRSSFPVVLTFQSFQISGHSSFPVPIVQPFQLSGRSCFPVVQIFQLFQLSCRSSIPVVPIVQSFQISGRVQLSGRSSFLVVPTFQSFQLSGRSCSPVFLVISALRSYWTLLVTPIIPAQSDIA